MSAPAVLRLLLVDDSEDDRQWLAQFFLDDPARRWLIEPAASVAEAASLLETRAFDLALVDWELPDGTGIELASHPQVLATRLPIIVMTGVERPDQGSGAVREGAADFLPKEEMTPAGVRRAATHALTRRALELDLEAVRRAETQIATVNAQLRTSEERFRRVVEEAPTGMVIVDESGVIALVNESLERMFGYSRDELIGRPVEVLVPSRFRGTYVLADASRGAARRELLGCRKDGSEFPMEVSFTGSSQVGARQVLGSLVDISERMQAEVARQETLEALRSFQRMIERVEDYAIFELDAEGRIRTWNAGARAIKGYESDEAIGKHISIFYPPETSSRPPEELRIAATTGRFEEEGWRLRKDGSRFWANVVITAVPGSMPESVGGFVKVVRDLTERKHYEESLRIATSQAEEANRAKSRFLANMSHEIRTPMNAIVGLSYLLGQSALDTEQAWYVSQVHVASQSLLALITNILDFSKIEAGELVVEHAEFDLSTLVGEVHDVAKMQADAKQISLTFDTPVDLPAVLEGDVTRLTQILTNLLSNAIKFTERGGVTLRIREEASTSTTSTLRFDVEDTGIGIAPDVKERLFAPFAQADASTTRRFGGTGLGLSIVKRLAELMGGDVTLVSAEDAGSVFSVRLPFRRGSTAPVSLHDAATAEPVPLQGVRVLVVDDSEINLIVARRILELQGAVVSVARNGLEAFEHLAKAVDAFDVVLMDVQMPILDGCETTRRIRRELGADRLPIIALTADARTTERERTTDAGMNDFISKPFEVDVVIQTIRRHLPRLAASS